MVEVVAPPLRMAIMNNVDPQRASLRRLLMQAQRASCTFFFYLPILPTGSRMVELWLEQIVAVHCRRCRDPECRQTCGMHDCGRQTASRVSVGDRTENRLA